MMKEELDLLTIALKSAALFAVAMYIITRWWMVWEEVQACIKKTRKIRKRAWLVMRNCLLCTAGIVIGGAVAYTVIATARTWTKANTVPAIEERLLKVEEKIEMVERLPKIEAKLLKVEGSVANIEDRLQVHESRVLVVGMDTNQNPIFRWQDVKK